MLNQLERMIIIRLQEEMPLVSEPYKIMAEEIGITEKELLSKIEEMKKAGILRRIGAFLHHRKAGYSANAMVVWSVPEEKAEEVGRIMSSFTQVSHCYQRSTFPGWPYSMFTMVHAKSEQECEAIVSKIADDVQIYDYELLYSTNEFKKASMRYFVEDREN